MMGLDIEQYNVVWYQDLQEFIKEIYDIQVDLLDTVPQELLGQNTFHDFVVNGNSELDTIGDDVIVEKWIITGQIKALDMSDVEHYWSAYADVEIRHFLHRLHAEGYIPAGKYMITVYW